MSAQKYGVEYLKSYSGILKLTQQVLNVTVLISGCICGFVLKSILINVNSIYAICLTTLFVYVNFSAIFRKSNFPWDWIECANSLIIAVLYLLGASIALSELTRIFVITGIISYIASMVYILETIDTFKLAVTPRSRYVWTTPNMPE